MIVVNEVYCFKTQKYKKNRVPRCLGNMKNILGQIAQGFQS